MAGIQNHLIEMLPRAGSRALLALCEPVDLVLSNVVCASGETPAYAYFPVNGIISLVTAIDGKPVLEVGMVGREGMVGAELVLGVLRSPLHAVVQGPGKAWRVRSSDFRRELARNPGLRKCLDRYLYVLMAQLGCSAACLRFHLIGPRLARWLLMMQDRAHSNRFHVTHEFLAYMLGVRRVGITSAASHLQRESLIEYRRGELIVLDRNGLEAAACGCYAADQLTYSALLG